MKKRFLVALERNQNEKPFNDYIKENGYAWWHWISGFWMLVDYSGELDCAKLSDDIDEIFPGVRRMVIEMPDSNVGDSWAGFGPKNEDKNMFKWIEENW